MKAHGCGPGAPVDRSTGSGWTFLSSYGHILLALAIDPAARRRDLAKRVGITDTALHRLLSEMEEANVIFRQRAGRRSAYLINRDVRLDHPIEEDRTIGDLIDLVSTPVRPGTT